MGIYQLQCHAFAFMSFNSLIFSVQPFAELCIFNMILMCDFSTIFSSVLLCSGYIYVYIFCHFKGVYFLSSKLLCKSVLAFSQCVFSIICCVVPLQFCHLMVWYFPFCHLPCCAFSIQFGCVIILTFSPLCFCFLSLQICTFSAIFI